MSIMKIIEGYDMSAPSQLNLSTHYLDESMRFAYGQRTLLGDPSFSPNLTAYQKEMYSEQTASEVRSKIEEFHTLNTSAYDPDGYGILTDSGTSAAVASDRSGLTIAITSTVNTPFGSQLMVPETGVIMNNEMNGNNILFILWASMYKNLWNINNPNPNPKIHSQIRREDFLGSKLTRKQTSASQIPQTHSATSPRRQTSSNPSKDHYPPSPPPSSSSPTVPSTSLTPQRVAPALSRK
jgi:hypothetical protein